MREKRKKGKETEEKDQRKQDREKKCKSRKHLGKGLKNRQKITAISGTKNKA